MEDVADGARRPGQLIFAKIDDIRSRVAAAADATRKFLFSIQQEEGFWCGELEADTTLESGYILLHRLLDTGDETKLAKAARYILKHQNADGGWSIYAGGPSNINASVQAYFALKLVGYPADHPDLLRARECILKLGGLTETNTYTKIYLCFFGQYDYEAIPALPPEIVLFPNWFWFNIYEISSWSRGILVPLFIAYGKRPRKQISPQQGVGELFACEPTRANMRLRWSDRLVSWRNFFLVLDHMTHWFERVHVRPLRSIAVKRAEKWMLERLEMSDGLGAIFPAMMNAIIALRCLGYSVDDPQFIRAMDAFEGLVIEEEDTLRVQPCKSPVWDTALCMYALGSSGVGRSDSRMIACADWLLHKQVNRLGDWSVKNRGVSPGGWYFEFENEFYPDVDDTAMVLLALKQVEHSDQAYQYKSVDRAIDWVLSMQCRNGGWASFDKDNDNMVFQNVPFADHNAMLDPPTADITGRVLEALSAYGFNRQDRCVKRAIECLRREQESDGSWFGRWGVNYVYGTMQVLRGLVAAGVDPREAWLQQAARWLRSVQNADGGWGETCASYDDASCKAVGPSTASQTAWAVMGLLAAGDSTSDAVLSGLAYLLRTQRKDGNWDEPYYTGTGFPRVFYLRYHLYRTYFPLLALTAYLKAASTEGKPALEMNV